MCDTKICAVCHQEKHLQQFVKAVSCINGRSGTCHQCAYEKAKQRARKGKVCRICGKKHRKPQCPHCIADREKKKRREEGKREYGYGITRTCQTCSKTKSVRLFPKVIARAKGVVIPGKFYYLKECKRCKADKQHERVLRVDPTRDVRKIVKAAKTIKCCNQCKEELSIKDNFRIRKGKSRIPENPPYQFYAAICKNCEKENKKYISKNWRDRILQTPEGKEHLRKSHREYCNKTGYLKKRVAAITDSYVKGIIVRDYNIQRKDIPQELIDLQRESIRVKRELKQLKQQMS
jgi:hypothetical protein